MSDASSSPQDIERLRDQVFSARLEALGARLDGRIASLEATITALSTRIEERFAQVDARMSNIAATVVATQKSIGGLKTTIIVTAIGAVIGVTTFNATLLSNLLASFEAGRNLSAAQAKILQQSERIEAILQRNEQGLFPPPKR